MKNKKCLIISVIILAVFVFSACGSPQGDLLQKDTAEVEEAVIYYADGSIVKLESGDQETAELTKALAGTKTKEKPIDLTTDAAFFSAFKYAIDITYQDNTTEQLFSDPDGEIFYRFINKDQAYIGGENKKINKILEEIKDKK